VTRIREVTMMLILTRLLNIFSSSLKRAWILFVKVYAVCT
jgi:hypothetical protein